MARIRTIKPEAFTSDSLASVSLTAERTFFGLLTQADDHGRHRDHAAVIAGALWPLRPDHTPIDVEDDLQQLAAAGLICRYTGDDGKPYLHITGWHKHQKIDRASRSRHPACPHHTAERGEASTSTHRVVAEPSAQVHRALAEDSREIRVDSSNHENTGQKAFDEDSAHTRRGFAEASSSPQGLDLGPRILEQDLFLRGTGARSSKEQPPVPSGNASASAPAPTPKALVDEYAATCTIRPPAKVLSHLASEVKQLLAEGIDPRHIRAGLERFRAKPMHPSVLPSLVNEAMNTAPQGDRRSRGTVHGHRPWTNPANPHDPTAYAEEL